MMNQNNTVSGADAIDPVRSLPGGMSWPTSFATLAGGILFSLVYALRLVLLPAAGLTAWPGGPLGDAIGLVFVVALGLLFLGLPGWGATSLRHSLIGMAGLFVTAVGELVWLVASATPLLWLWAVAPFPLFTCLIAVGGVGTAVSLWRKAEFPRAAVVLFGVVAPVGIFLSDGADLLSVLTASNVSQPFGVIPGFIGFIAYGAGWARLGAALRRANTRSSASDVL